MGHKTIIFTCKMIVFAEASKISLHIDTTLQEVVLDIRIKYFFFILMDRLKL